MSDRTTYVYKHSPAGDSLVEGGVWSEDQLRISLQQHGLGDVYLRHADEFRRLFSTDPQGAPATKVWDAESGAVIVVEAAVLPRTAVITKREDGYHVMSEKGKHLGGPYASREKAEERMQQVEMFKNMKKASAAYTDEMEDWFNERTQAHIDRVAKYCRKIHEIFGDKYAGILERAEQHDASKLQDPEREPYIFITEKHRAKREGREFEAPAGMEEAMFQATQHHVIENNHHPEHWSPDQENTINRQDRDKPSGKLVDATAMPDLDLCEMVADWSAMAEELGGTPREWAQKNVNIRWKFSEPQVNTIYNVIDAVWPPSGKKASRSTKLPMDDKELAFEAKPGQVVAIDYDGTITKNPPAFKSLVDKIHASGSKAILLTARPDDQREQILGWLSGHGIQVDDAYLFPEHYDHAMFDKDREGWMAKHVAWKSKALAEMGATDFIDDSIDYAASVAENNPEVNFYLAVTEAPVQPWKDLLMPKTDGTEKKAAANPDEKAITWEKAVSIDSLLVVFHEEFFDYYLRVPEQPDGYYITDIGDQKVGFGSKYQLRKFLEQLKEERYISGTIPELNIVLKPIPTLSAPVVRRLGGKAPQVVDEHEGKDEKRHNMQPNPPPDYSAITDSVPMSVKPSGPMI